MVLFRLTSDSLVRPVIRAEGLVLRPPRINDYAAWAMVRARSRAFLTPWEPSWSEDELSRAAFKVRVKRASEEIRGDLAYPLLVFSAGEEQLMGAVTIGLIRRGVAQMCTLGYWIGEPFARQGHMSKAVRLAAQFAVDDLGLRRIEAACLPANLASQRLLEKTGFVQEGYARQYLRINGHWADHLLYARLAHDVPTVQTVC
jgi:[ribosomal protein S5]-alanine N-acetyltransferase